MARKILDWLWLIILIAGGIFLYLLTAGRFSLPRLLRTNREAERYRQKEIEEEKDQLEKERKKTDKIGGDGNSVVDRADDFLSAVDKLLGRNGGQ